LDRFGDLWLTHFQDFLEEPAAEVPATLLDLFQARLLFPRTFSRKLLVLCPTLDHWLPELVDSLEPSLPVNFRPQH